MTSTPVACVSTFIRTVATGVLLRTGCSMCRMAFSEFQATFTWRYAICRCRTGADRAPTCSKPLPRAWVLPQFVSCASLGSKRQTESVLSSTAVQVSIGKVASSSMGFWAVRRPAGHFLHSLCRPSWVRLGFMCDTCWPSPVLARAAPPSLFIDHLPGCPTCSRRGTHLQFAARYL